MEAEIWVKGFDEYLNGLLELLNRFYLVVNNGLFIYIGKAFNL